MSQMQQLPLSEADPAIWEMIKKEDHRQRSGLEMIASENFTSRAVLEALGSCLTNKYAEGLPGKRYYGGTEFVDQVESLCIERALQAFDLDPAVWGVNVQSYSGSIANINVYTALLQPGDKLLGLGLASGGHLSHGFKTEVKKVSASSVFWESHQYGLTEEGLVDYDALEALALSVSPKLIICGASAYPRDWDYARIRAIADKVGASFMCDMAHYAGLVAGKVVRSPFEFCDVVSSTTHKTLRGPRAGIIFFRQHLANAVNSAVFPGVQGGPHMNAIAAIATAMREVNTEEFHQYAKNVVANSRALAAALVAHGYRLQTGGTDTHLVLWDLRPNGVTGSKVELVLEIANISTNKNAVQGDTKMLTPGGLRVGTAPLTTRGLVPEQCETLADFLHRGVQIAIRIQGATSTLAEFRAAAHADSELAALRQDVEAFALRLPMPGFPAFE